MYAIIKESKKRNKPLTPNQLTIMKYNSKAIGFGPSNNRTVVTTVVTKDVTKEVATVVATVVTEEVATVVTEEVATVAANTRKSSRPAKRLTNEIIPIPNIDDQSTYTAKEFCMIAGVSSSGTIKQNLGLSPDRPRIGMGKAMAVYGITLDDLKVMSKSGKFTGQVINIYMGYLNR